MKNKIVILQANVRHSGKLLKVYQDSSVKSIGFIKRDIDDIKNFFKDKSSKVFVAIEKGKKDKILGFCHLEYLSAPRLGIITELVVIPGVAYRKTASALVKKSLEYFKEKKEAWDYAFTTGDSRLASLYKQFEMFESESNGKFMFAIFDDCSFLERIAPVFLKRLARAKYFKGVLVVRCASSSLSFRKDGDGTAILIRADNVPNVTIDLNTKTLSKAMLGFSSTEKLLKSGEMRVLTSNKKDKTSGRKLAMCLFPKNDFITLDQW